jgi:3-isopropylmalate dehydratase small subunit
MILFRARIWPLIKISGDEIIPGAYWRKANDEEEALRAWASADEEGIVDRL